MKLSRDIQSLSVFKRDSAKLIKQLKKSGEPMILTVNGKAAAVVMDPDTYEAYAREKDHLDVIAAVRKAREDVKAGRVRDAEEFFDEMFAKYDIPWKE